MGDFFSGGFFFLILFILNIFQFQFGIQIELIMHNNNISVFDSVLFGLVDVKERECVKERVCERESV